MMLSLAIVALAGGQSVVAADATDVANGSLPKQALGPAVGRWLQSSFTGPEDGLAWHSLFYLTDIERPQLLTRHSGLMLRCTEAPVPNNLRVAFAFGAVLRTNVEGDVAVEVALDRGRKERLPLVTRNHTNAEFPWLGAKAFLQQLMTTNILQFGARLSPKGNAKVTIPLAPGRSQVRAMLKQCGIDLAAEVLADQRSLAARRLAAVADTDDDAAQNARTPLEGAISAYLAANSVEELQVASAVVVQLNPSVNSLIAALQAPDALAKNASTGLPGRGDTGVSEREVDGVQLPFHVAVPAVQPPAQGLPLAIVLHGGVRRPPWRERERWWQDYPFNNLLKDFLVVSPASWREAFWWSGTQQRNLSELIAQMQRHYMVDASRVFVIGVSDGGAGALHLAMTDATPLAGVVSLIGHPGVLFDEQINSEPSPQFANLTQLPVFMVNGEVDARMPPATLAPWLQSMRVLGVSVSSYMEPGMGHALDFSDAVTSALEKFLDQTRRVIDPPELAWEAAAEQVPARHRWLVIEGLLPGAQRGCVRARRTKEGGYTLQTEGVAQLRVLLDHDSEQALQLAINSDTSNPQTSRLETAPSVATLMRWHTSDANRTRFFSSEHLLEITGSNIGVCQSDLARTIVAEASTELSEEELRESRAQRAAKLRASNPLGGNRSDDLFRSGNDARGGEESQTNQPGDGRSVGDPTRINTPGSATGRRPLGG